jgi:hypothetical protein
VPRAAVLFLVAAATALAFVVRLVVVAVTRTRWPHVAAGVERWWVWTPVVAVCLVAIWVVPLIGIPATIVGLVLLTRAGTVGSPFRPRR